MNHNGNRIRAHDPKKHNNIVIKRQYLGAWVEKSRCHEYDPIYTTSKINNNNNNNNNIKLNPPGIRIKNNNNILHGRDHYKFFKRPLMSLQPSLAHEVLSDAILNRNENDSSRLNNNNNHNEQMTRNVAIQTMYRESNTQTDPYSPPPKPIDDNDERPELLDIQHMKWGTHLPAALEEVEEIQRIRERRAFEASLPKAVDRESFELRRKLLEAQELKEWKRREKVMAEEQEARLQLLVKKLRAREQKTEEFMEKRIQQLSLAKEREKNRALQAIERRRKKTTRNLKRLNKYLPRKIQKHDIIDEFDEIDRELEEAEKNNNNKITDYDIGVISSIRELNEFEHSLPAKVSEAKIKIPTKVVPTSMRTRAGQQLADDLKYVDSLLAASKANVNRPLERVENMYKRYEPIVRPPTPTKEPIDMAPHRAACFLQRILRGRCIQNQFYHEKQHNLALIRELQYNTPNIISSSSSSSSSSPNINIKQENNNNNNKEITVDNVVDLLEAAIIHKIRQHQQNSIKN